MPRLRWKPAVGFNADDVVLTRMRASIQNLQAGLAMRPYVAGAQAATTTVSWPPVNPQTMAFQTELQMHSEMRALGAMLDRGDWALNGHVVAPPVPPASYTTNLSHCGWCTVMLVALGLPVGVPTRGQYNFAANLDYPVPAHVLHSPDVLFHLFDSAGANGPVDVKVALDACIGNAADDWVLELPDGTFATSTAIVAEQPADTVALPWNEAMGHTIAIELGAVRGSYHVLAMLWKLVFAGIYLATM